MFKRKKASGSRFAKLAGASLLSAGFAGTAKVEGAQPNVVIILADDMGYSDIFADDIDTPYLDMMVSNGVTFTHFYNNAKCSPTRSSLLTGSYDIREDRNKPHLPTAMRNAGYLTGMVGKVHGHLTRGFDRDFTLFTGSFNYFNPEKPQGDQLKQGKTNNLSIHIDGETIEDWTSPEGFYTTDDFTDYGMSYMDDAKQQGKPFFLYMAYNAPHWPLQAWPEDIAKYEGKYRVDFDLIRAARLEAMIQGGVLPPTTQLSPRDENLDSWNTLSEEEKDEFDALLATHAAMVDRLDQNIGRLLQKIKDIGEEENTIVMFLSDNGAAATKGGNNVTPEIPIGASGSFAGIGPRGANLSCAPFRKYKTWDHEGGISTPLVAYWPGQITNVNRIVDTPAHVIDILPTCLDVAGIPQENVTDAEHMNGISFFPLLQNETMDGHSEIYWKYGKGKAVRQDDWKLVAHEALNDGDWALYSVTNDRTELNDVADQNPETVASLSLLWNTWYATCKNLFIELDRESLGINEGTTNGFRVRLVAPPLHESTVSVAWVSGDTDITVTTGSSLVFTTNNWNDWQNVVLSAAEDLDWIANEATIECSRDGEIKTLIATEIENDEEVQIWTSLDALDVPEGATASFQVRLTAQPVSNRTVAVAQTSGDTDITVQNGSELLFTQSNWNTNQAVTLFAAQDADWHDGTAIITCSSSNMNDKTLTATESDDETDPDKTLPFTETFDSLNPGALANQHGWTGTGTVQTTTFQSGTKALSLSESSVAHTFDGNPSNVWITLWAQPVTGIEPETIASGASAVFYVSTNNLLVAYSNTTPIEIAGATVSNGWNKIEISCDYVSKLWNLELNGVPTVGNFPFYGNPSNFQALEISENTTNTLFVDSIHLTDTTGPTDTDSDGIPDSWEQKHYGGSTNAIATNRCSNGINTIREAYIAGLDPTNATSLFKLSDLSSKTSGSVLSWNATNGRIYSVYWSSNLLSPFILLTNDLSWTSSVFTDETHNAESKGFYKIEVELE